MIKKTTENLLVFHAMFAQGFGGIEAAYVRYTEALLALGCRVVAVTAPGSAAAGKLPAGVEIVTLPNRSQWDLLAWWRAKRLIHVYRPDLILTHGNRAGRILGRVRGNVPHIAVLHRPRYRGLDSYDHVISVTNALRQGVLATGVPDERISVIPNFLPLSPAYVPNSRRTPQNTPPIIGFLGRFVPEKGLDILVDSLNILQSRGVAFQAVIGGEGAERSLIETKIASYGLTNKIRLLGWITSPEAFYGQIDLLCVPSRAESFGLIILEAWALGVPVVATQTSGPKSLITHEDNGLLAAISAEALAEQLTRLLQDSSLYAHLSHRGAEALHTYRMEAILPQLQTVMDTVIRTKTAA